MKINNKFDAIHAMSTLRRMEISGEDCTKEGSARYCAIYEAAEEFFSQNPCAAWNTFASNTNF